MAISNVWIEDGCTECGLCEELCPDVFYMNGVARIKKNIDFSESEQEIIDAADNCPVDVIKYE